MIVKCQRSRFPSDGSLLFYNRKRDRLGEFESTPEWNKLFGKSTSPTDNKFFAEVDWPDATQLPTFIRKVEYQNW